MATTHQELINEVSTFSQAGLGVEKSGKGFVIIKTQDHQRQRWSLYSFIGKIPEHALRYKNGAYVFDHDLPSK